MTLALKPLQRQDAAGSTSSDRIL